MRSSTAFISKYYAIDVILSEICDLFLDLILLVSFVFLNMLHMNEIKCKIRQHLVNILKL